MATDGFPILRALTPEAEESLRGAAEAAVTGSPFRVGRESRGEPEQGVELFGGRDRRAPSANTNNDLYLHDPGRLKHISREHFIIERRPDGSYLLEDRGSACGTIVGNVAIGGRRRTGQCPLEDGNVIVVGNDESPFVYQFLLNARE